MLRVATSSIHASRFVQTSCTKASVLHASPLNFTLLASSPNRAFSTLHNKTSIPKNALVVQAKSTVPKQSIIISRTYHNNAPEGPTVTTNYRYSNQNALPWIVGAVGFAGLVGLTAYGFAQAEENPREGYVTSRLRYTYAYLLGSLGLTAGVVRLLAKSTVPYRVATANPLLMFGISIAALLGTQILTVAIPYENTVAKHAAWASFCSALGMVISPVAFAGGQVLSQAAMATGAIVGSLSLVGASDPTGTFLNMGGPLSIGLGVLIAASLGSVMFPAVTALQSAVVYGGTALFGFFVLHDTQKVQYVARNSPRYDPINNCIGLVMDTVNIFMFMVNIFSNRRR